MLSPPLPSLVPQDSQALGTEDHSPWGLSPHTPLSRSPRLGTQGTVNSGRAQQAGNAGRGEWAESGTDPIELRQEIADRDLGPARQPVGRECSRKGGQEGREGRFKGCPFQAGGNHHGLGSLLRDLESWDGGHTLRRQTERVSLGMKKESNRSTCLQTPKFQTPQSFE